MSILIPYTRLSNEQKQIIERFSNVETNLFVSGPAGSGKTLISLYILNNIIENKTERPLLLMYNHSLYGFLSTSLKELGIGENVTIATKDKLFWDIAREKKIWADKGLKSYEEKYECILNKLTNEHFNKDYGVTVVDEVQDLLPEEWNLLKRLSKKIISLGDFDQGIYNTKIDEESIKNYGEYERLDTIRRFPINIAKLAAPFSSNGDELINMVVSDAQTQPILVDVDFDDEYDTIIEIVDQLRIENQSIGVLCPNSTRLQQLSDYLNNKGFEHHYYPENSDLRNHDFTSTKPLLITIFSSKGLEFDKVILFGFDDSWVIDKMRKENRLKSAIFVGITRTKSSLYVIRNEYAIDELKNLKVEAIEDLEEDEYDFIF